MRDPWRYRCPNGHTSWNTRRNNPEYTGRTPQADYYCKVCGPFDELLDMKLE